jgi:capsular exopolysaccharide synthesis family protein
VILTVAAAVAGSLVYLHVRSPVYSATAKLLINPLPSDETIFLGLPYVRDARDPTRTVQTAAGIIDSPSTAQLAARRLGSGWTRQRVENAVSVTPQGQSNIVNITANAHSAKLAARVANSFSEAFFAERRAALRLQVGALIKELQARQLAVPAHSSAVAQLRNRIVQLQEVADGSDPTITRSQRAIPPVAAAGASSALAVLLALLAGAVLGVGAALLIDLVTPRRLSDESRLRELYPLPILVRVPTRQRRTLRSSARELDVAGPEREPFRSLRVQLGLSHRTPRTIAVTSPSRGDGKTTTATTLALEFAGAGKEVILIDLDLRKPDVAGLLHVKPSSGIAGLVDLDRQLSDAVTPVRGIARLTVVADHEPAGAPMLDALSARLPTLLAQGRALADYVIIDTPPLGEVSDALPIIENVDDVILVTRVGSTSETSLEVVRDLLDRAGVEPLGFVVIGTSRRASGYAYAYPESKREQRADSGRSGGEGAGLRSARRSRSDAGA